jgi:predicted nuclease with TOPRIM domain
VPTTPNVSKITLIKVSRPKYTNCLGALELETNCGEDDNSPREDLRGRLDKDEQFLELPELYDLVDVVAERFGLNDSLLLKQYRCQDQVATCKSLLGKSMIRVPDKMDFRPAVVIARQVKIG